jgi:hypothetical protein
MFRRYTTLHVLITVAAFSVAAVWIAISASRHNTAKVNCEQKFFSATSGLTSEGSTMCEIFPWVDVGLMGGLWVLLLISQVLYSNSPLPLVSLTRLPVLLLHHRLRVWRRSTWGPREI